MPPQKSLTRGGWRSVALSILLHAAIVAAAVYGWFTWKHKPPEPETMAIQGTVVDERALKGISPPPEPAPTPPPEPEPEPQPPPEEQGPPKPDPEEVKQRQEERLAQERAEQEKQEQLQREKEAQELKLKEEAERVEQQKIEEQKEAAAKLNEERAAAEKRAAEKRRAEEARKAAEEKARKAQEEELRRNLEAEERGNAARNSEEATRWHASIVAKIQRAWIRPPTAVAGATCIVLVSQVPGGEVTSVRVSSCQPNEAALRQSVENAVYAASPLPTPPPGVPFERNLELTFAPQ